MNSTFNTTVCTCFAESFWKYKKISEKAVNLGSFLQCSGGTYILGHNGCLWKINLGILWDHTTKNFQVKYGYCDSIIFPETFSSGSSEYSLDLPLGDNRILLTGLGMYPQISHRTPFPAVLICKGGLINSKGGVGLFRISQKERLFSSFVTTKCSWGLFLDAPLPSCTL